MTQSAPFQLQTERLILRKLQAADVDAWLAIRTHPDVARFQPWHISGAAEALAFLRHLDALEIDTPGTWFQLALVRQADDRLLGDLGIRFPADDVRQVELGITLDPAEQGHGYAAEALSAVLDYLVGALGKHRVVASTDPANRPCIALLTGLGMRQEAHHRESYWFNGAWTDDLVFAILEREWPLPIEQLRADGPSPRRQSLLQRLFRR